MNIKLLVAHQRSKNTYIDQITVQTTVDSVIIYHDTFRWTAQGMSSQIVCSTGHLQPADGPFIVRFEWKDWFSNLGFFFPPLIYVTTKQRLPTWSWEIDSFAQSELTYPVRSTMTSAEWTEPVENAKTVYFLMLGSTNDWHSMLPVFSGLTSQNPSSWNQSFKPVNQVETNSWAK